jgi:hypothetical protein
MLQGTAMTPFIVILLLCFAVSKAFVCNEYTTFLKLFRMNLDAFPDLRNCSAYLTSLDVSDNQITSIPAEIGTFVNLQELNVNNNLLQELPAEIGQLYNLRTLRVYANKLRQLPVEFRNLTSLQELHAEYNELTSLPMLPNLSMLYVGFNNLTSIPAEYGHLSNLNTLDAYSNPLTCLPRSVKALPNLSSGSFYLPACTNHSIEGFLTNRTAQKGTCGGFGKYPQHCIAPAFIIRYLSFLYNSLQDQRHRAGLLRLRAHHLHHERPRGDRDQALAVGPVIPGPGLRSRCPSCGVRGGHLSPLRSSHWRRHRLCGPQR